jgi:competence protein ComEA
MVLGGLLVATLVSTMLRVPAPGTGPAARSGELRCGVNPNTAPWWELTALPGVGDVTAHRIVQYRDAHATGKPVFRHPADLDAVPGIGPKTVARVTPYLVLPNHDATP